METLRKETQKQIGQYVAEDYRTAGVFSKYGIDFCCKGHRTIEEVCTKNNIDSNELLNELDKVLTANTNQSIYREKTSQICGGKNPYTTTVFRQTLQGSWRKTPRTV